MLTLSHKNLITWQKAMELLPLIYELCKKLPKEETYNLVSQIKRATLSVSNNLAEGASRKSSQEKNRFFEIARSSLVEIDNCLEACIRLKYLIKDDTQEAEFVIEEIFKLCTGLIKVNRMSSK